MFEALLSDCLFSLRRAWLCFPDSEQRASDIYLVRGRFSFLSLTVLCKSKLDSQGELDSQGVMAGALNTQSSVEGDGCGTRAARPTPIA